MQAPPPLDLLGTLKPQLTPPTLPPPINYIRQHIYLACNMENSYSYLGFSGLTLINVMRSVAPRGVPPYESCPVKFQSSL